MSLFGAMLHDLLDIVERNISVSPEDTEKLQELQAKAMQVAHKTVETFNDASEEIESRLNELKDAFDEKVRELEEDLGNRVIELQERLNSQVKDKEETRDSQVKDKEETKTAASIRKGAKS